MGFPETRVSLIERLANSNDTASWREFLDAYWSPICRFARRHAEISESEAEDIASQVLEILFANQLLGRWSSMQAARLRTLICTVAKHVLANRNRIEQGRARLIREHVAELERYLSEAAGDVSQASTQEGDAFYGAWVDEFLQAVLEQLLQEYNSEGKGDYFRVLYGQICEQMTVPEISEALSLKRTTTENYLRHARQRLQERLQEAVRVNVLRYASPEHVDEEIRSEWSQLGSYLKQHGGLDAVLRRVSGEF